MKLLIQFFVNNSHKHVAKCVCVHAVIYDLDDVAGMNKRKSED